MSISGILSSGFLQKQFGAPSIPYQQSIEQLSKDLQSGNLSAAQKDFFALQQDLENLGGPGSTNRFHHYHRLGTNIEDLTNPNSLLQDLNQVRQNLMSGNLFAAQQAYAMLRAQAPASTVFGQHQTEPPVSGPPTSVAGLVDRELIGPPISVLA